MARKNEISVYFSTNVILALKWAGFQTKNAMELLSCKQIKHFVQLSPDKLKTLSGSLVLDLRI